MATTTYNIDSPAPPVPQWVEAAWCDKIAALTQIGDRTPHAVARNEALSAIDHARIYRESGRMTCGLNLMTEIIARLTPAAA